MDEDEWDKVSFEGLLPEGNEFHRKRKCWAVNVKGSLHLLREALSTFNANPEGGVFLTTSSVAVGSPVLL